MKDKVKPSDLKRKRDRLTKPNKTKSPGSKVIEEAVELEYASDEVRWTRLFVSFVRVKDHVLVMLHCLSMQCMCSICFSFYLRAELPVSCIYYAIHHVQNDSRPAEPGVFIVESILASRQQKGKVSHLACSHTYTPTTASSCATSV